MCWHSFVMCCSVAKQNFVPTVANVFFLSSLKVFYSGNGGGGDDDGDGDFCERHAIDLFITHMSYTNQHIDFHVIISNQCGCLLESFAQEMFVTY